MCRLGWTVKNHAEVLEGFLAGFLARLFARRARTVGLTVARVVGHNTESKHREGVEKEKSGRPDIVLSAADVLPC